MTTDPGAVPKNAMPCLDDDAEMDYEAVGERSTKYKKFCKRCKAFKPVRAHHCSICARCIIKVNLCFTIFVSYFYGAIHFLPFT